MPIKLYIYCNFIHTKMWFIYVLFIQSLFIEKLKSK